MRALVLGLPLVLAACTSPDAGLTNRAVPATASAAGTAATRAAPGASAPGASTDCPPAPVVTGARVRDGHIDFDVLAVQAPIRSIIGTHAEFEPHGQYVRVRVAVQNPDSTFHGLRTDAQALLDTAGQRVEPSIDAMRIKRQPDDIDLGAGNRLEFDLWFDLPDGATPAALLVRADGCGRTLALPPARP